MHTVSWNGEVSGDTRQYDQRQATVDHQDSATTGKQVVGLVGRQRGQTETRKRRDDGVQERIGGQPRVADRTRTGKAGSGASEWGPKLEWAKPKSSDRKGRRSVESSYLGMAKHRTLGAQCMHPREVAKYPGTLGHPSPVAANALPPSSSTSCSLVLVLP